MSAVFSVTFCKMQMFRMTLPLGRVISNVVNRLVLFPYVLVYRTLYRAPYAVISLEAVAYSSYTMEWFWCD